MDYFSGDLAIFVNEASALYRDFRGGAAWTSITQINNSGCVMAARLHVWSAGLWKEVMAELNSQVSKKTGILHMLVCITSSELKVYYEHMRAFVSTELVDLLTFSTTLLGMSTELVRKAD